MVRKCSTHYLKKIYEFGLELTKGEKPPDGFQYVNCYVVFDIKDENFWRKVHLVARSHMINTLDTIIYSSLVVRETVCIAFTIAVFYDLKVKAADVLNTNVTAPNHEKIKTVLGPEFGDDADKSAIIVRVLYRLMSSGSSYRAHVAQCIWELGYCFCNANFDLWMKAQYRPENRLVYYLYIFCYVDDISCIHYHSDDVLNKLNGYVLLKLRLVWSPDMCLGTKLEHMQLNNGIWTWSMRSSK